MKNPLQSIRFALVFLFAIGLGAQTASYRAQPQFTHPGKTDWRFDGFLGQRLRANLENWELRAPEANPAMLEMFFDRERKPDRRLLPWSGEFVGKYLCSSILSYRILRDPRQKETIERVTATLLKSQGPDGYLGPFDSVNRLTGRNWDIWGHYWVMRALILTHEEFGSAAALEAARRAADLLVAKFLDQGVPLTNDGSFGQMNYAVIHAFTKLYSLTGKPEYLRMAQWIVRMWDQPGAGLYMRYGLLGKEMHEFPGNRWESLHDFQGMYEMYLLTGEAKFRDVFTHIWYGILKGDRHNTGGFTSGEKTTGNPYDQGAIETCCTIAWMDMSIDMLRLTGDARVADEIELSTFNGMIGGQHPSGRWWTYNTPMDGVKQSSAHSIVFQARPGSPELNCCSVNGPRGLGLLTEWAVLRTADGFALNYYGPSRFIVETRGGQRLALEQQTSYPVEGVIKLRIGLSKPERFTLRLRIPSWSGQTQVSAPGKPLPGSYFPVEREWKEGDMVTLDLDMSLHYWAGERELDAKTSIYRGPVLLAFDPVYSSMEPDAVPEMDAIDMDPRIEKSQRAIEPLLLLSVKSRGDRVRLCDFATAGAYGNNYRSWLPVGNLAPAAFERNRPVWVNRPRR